MEAKAKIMQNADIHVLGDDRIAERDGHKAHDGREHCQYRSSNEHCLIGAAGDRQLFGHQFDAVERRLEQTERSVDVWAGPSLNTGSTSSFRPDQIGGIESGKGYGEQQPP